MRLFFGILARWLTRHTIVFFVIVAILMAGIPLKLSYDKYVLIDNERGVERDISASLKKLEAASQIAVNSRIESVKKQLNLKKADQQKIASLLPLTSGKTFIAQQKLKFEITGLKEELALLSGMLKSKAAKPACDELKRLQILHELAYKRYLKTNKELGTTFIFTDERKKLHEARIESDLAAEKVHKQEKISNCSVVNQFNSLKNQLERKATYLENSIKDNWFGKLNLLFESVAWPAAFILLSIILVPIAIKVVFYFFLAPFASRLAPICLMPNASGIIDGTFLNAASEHKQPKISAVSHLITVDENSEILIHPEYLQSSSTQGEKDTSWLLDWSHPLSSLASGMFGLTRIRAKQLESFSISETAAPLNEVGIVSLPEGSSIVLQPHNLVGIVQFKDKPVRITSHWRLFSLHAWLTLQLRYLIFHGPVKLIIKGCRGIKIESSGNGRCINQAAIIGFSANLDYSTTRCETFSSYLMGKQELFNDHFAGKSGFYIYEEMPHFGKKSGITGRGLEGITDSFLKVFGV